MILGPAPAPMALLRGRYRYRLLLNARRSAEVQQVIRDWLGALSFPQGVRVGDRHRSLQLRLKALRFQRGGISWPARMARAQQPDPGRGAHHQRDHRASSPKAPPVSSSGPAMRASTRPSTGWPGHRDVEHQAFGEVPGEVQADGSHSERVIHVGGAEQDAGLEHDRHGATGPSPRALMAWARPNSSEVTASATQLPPTPRSSGTGCRGTASPRRSPP